MQVILEDYERQGGEEAEESGYKAVNMCGQEPYPGDDEQLKMEYEAIERRYAILSHCYWGFFLGVGGGGFRGFCLETIFPWN